MKSPRARVKLREIRKASASPAPDSRVRRWPYIVGLFVLLYVAFHAYAPALHGPFLFDDAYLPFSIPAVADQPLQAWTVGVRPLLMFTYWLNYQISASKTFSYHVFNLLLHLINTLLVFFILRKVLSLAQKSSDISDSAPRDLLAGFAASIFFLHPIQTESVSYVTGRSETLSVLFFFAAFAVFLYRNREAVSWKVAFAVLALFGCALLTKEHTAVLPGLLLLTDYYWNPGFSLAGVRRNWRLYSLICVTGLAGIVGIWRILRVADSAGFALKDFTWYQYFFTECRVIFVYLRLFLFPVNQTIDYDFPISRTIFEHGAILAMAGLLVLAGGAIYFRRRYPLASYGVLVFLILLAPTSSFVPIKDPIAERRLYLPMLGLLFVLLEFLRRLRADRKALAVGLSVTVVIMGTLTYKRNHVWSDATALWQDAVEKSPRKARAHFQLAFAYYLQGRCDEALQHYNTVAQLEPADYRLLVDWALAYDCVNQPEKALTKLREAAAMEPTAHVHALIGMVQAKQQAWAQAMESFQSAVKLDPNFEMTYVYRGNLSTMLNDLAAATADFRRALAINPKNQFARNGLAVVEERIRSAH